MVSTFRPYLGPPQRTSDGVGSPRTRPQQSPQPHPQSQTTTYLHTNSQPTMDIGVDVPGRSNSVESMNGNTIRMTITGNLKEEKINPANCVVRCCQIRVSEIGKYNFILNYLLCCQNSPKSTCGLIPLPLLLWVSP